MSCEATPSSLLASPADAGRSWIISLGAGREQLPLIRAIQAEGYWCMAFDKDLSALFASGANGIAEVSNRDIEAIYEHAKKWDGEVAGVMASASEVPDVMAILAHRLGTPGIPVAAGMLLKDKLRYKQVLKAAGVPHTEAHEIYGGGVKALFDQLGYEVVVKPRVSSGSRGVFLCRHDPMGLVGRLADAADADHSGLIMERYQSGPQISIECLIWEGDCHTAAFVDRFYDSFAKEVGGSAPSHWESLRGDANEVMWKAAKALGIRNGTLKGDLVLTEDGPVIIELTCRLSGGSLFQVVRESEGVDYVRQAVRIAVGKEPQWELMIPSSIPKQIVMDLQGNRMDWEESRKYLTKELSPWRR